MHLNSPVDTMQQYLLTPCMHTHSKENNRGRVYEEERKIERKGEWRKRERYREKKEREQLV